MSLMDGVTTAADALKKLRLGTTPTGSLTQGTGTAANLPAYSSTDLLGDSSTKSSDDPSSTLTSGSRDIPLESDAAYQAFLNSAQLSDDQARADATLQQTQAQQSLTTRLADLARQAGIQQGQIGNSARYRGFGSSSQRESLEAQNTSDEARAEETGRTDTSNQIDTIQSALNRALADTQMQRGAQSASAAGRLQTQQDNQIQQQKQDQYNQQMLDAQHAQTQALIDATNRSSQQEVAQNTDPYYYNQATQLQQGMSQDYLASQSLAQQLAALKVSQNPSYVQAVNLQNQIQQDQVNAYLKSQAIAALKQQAAPNQVTAY